MLARGQLGPKFLVHKGVLQGCPCSPLVFSLFVDRLEKFLLDHATTWTQREQDSIRLGAYLLPVLLFADDLVLAARKREVAQRLLDLLESWCSKNKLQVNTDKTKWMYLPGRKRYKRSADADHVEVIRRGGTGCDLPLVYSGVQLERVKMSNTWGLNLSAANLRAA